LRSTTLKHGLKEINKQDGEIAEPDANNTEE